MCGIVGYVGTKNAVPILMEGLRGLEYRGYDSAGIGIIGRGRLKVVKREGDVGHLAGVLPKGLSSLVGIGHTRWATHGGVSDVNAHPHLDTGGTVAVVHNGIIYNYAALRKELTAQGVAFASETDSEVIAQLAGRLLAAGRTPEEAVRGTLQLIQGTYGLIFLFADHPDLLIGARSGSPLIVGIADHGMLLASDANAIVEHTRRVVHLDDGETVVLTRDGHRTKDLRDQPVDKAAETLVHQPGSTGKGGFRDYMLKEIFEQGATLARAMGGRLIPEYGTTKLAGLNLDRRDFFDIRRVQILAMGTAHHAAMVGAYLLETIARIPARAEIASELRCRNPIIEKETLYLAVSQSGETADTLLALREIRGKGGRVLGVVNVVGSAIAREADGGLYTHAGPEMAVASTKAFTGQLLVLTLIALHFARMRDLSLAEGKALVREIADLPRLVEEALAGADGVRRIALKHQGARAFLFLGRGISHPMALEGALKLKEIAYCFAEGMSAGDVKHGPIALVDETVTVVVVAVAGDNLERTIGAMEEVKARRGRIVVITNSDDERLAQVAGDVIRVPPTREALSPLLTAIPLQLFAYHLGAALKRNIDRPRNLAKSLTVE